MCFESQGFSGAPGACTLPQASVLKAGRAPGLWHKHRSLGAQGRAVASLFFVFFPSSFEVYVFPVGTEFTSDIVLLFGTTDTLALLCIYIDVFHFRLLLPYRLLETVEQSPSCWPVCPCRLLFVC